MTETVWDRLLDLLDHLAANPGAPATGDVERTFATLCTEAAGDDPTS